MLKKLLLASSLAGSGLLLCLLSGCASNKTDPYLGNSADYIYAKGHAALQKGDDSDALTAYQSLDSQYPLTVLTQKGDLESIYAYYDSDNPAMAVTAASRYTKIYPTGPNLDYAYYMMGVVDFENGRGFLQKFFPYDMAEHNADNYNKAFSYFDMIVSQYPNSQYAPDARRRMIYLNNTLAQYQLNVANFYMQKKAYVTAVNRAKNILLDYPNTPQARTALAVMAQAYEKLGLTDLAASAQAVSSINPEVTY